MKLTYRDKVILAIVLAAAIFAGGFFGLIKPKNTEIKDNQATLETLKKDEKEIKRKIKRIDTVSDNISKIHAKSKEDTAVFVGINEINETKKLDEYMYDYAEKAHVKITELKTDPITAAALNYYYTPYVEVATALRESADINGDLREKVAKESEDSTYISSRGVENIISARYGLTIEGKKAEIWDYLEMIEDIDSAVIITSVSLSKVEEEETEKKATPAVPEGQTPQEEKKEDSDADEYWDDETVLEANIVIQLYSVYEMPEPDTSEK